MLRLFTETNRIFEVKPLFQIRFVGLNSDVAFTEMLTQHYNMIYN